MSLQKLHDSILQGDRIALGKAITLAESKLPEHQSEVEELLEAVMPFCGKSIRIGITGIPGVGKSTFIESFGNYLIKEENRKIAVLAVDPSSSISKGSILGDKTRMENLSKNENAFIRASPSTGTLGGVSSGTRETILLCEAAGFDTIFIETVGVGQSETAVYSMVDFMLLLLLPGAGDELQGMKRGIVELADLIAINKSDGDNLQKAKIAQAAYRQALHLFPAKENDWQPEVVLCSSLSGEGIDLIWNKIKSYEIFSKDNNSFFEKRKRQNVHWMKEILFKLVFEKYSQNPDLKAQLTNKEKLVAAGKMSVLKAARELMENIN